jgi:hypothetical protein
MFSAKIHELSLGDASGTSIIDIGLLRPAAAPGGRRVDGSRLGVAILHILHMYALICVVLSRRKKGRSWVAMFVFGSCVADDVEVEMF